MKKRLLSVLLIVCLCAALLPTVALADGGTSLLTVSGSHDGFTAAVDELVKKAVCDEIESSIEQFCLKNDGIEMFSLKYVDKAGNAPTEATTLTIRGVDLTGIDSGKPVYVIVASVTRFSDSSVYRAELGENGDLRFTMGGSDSKKHLGNCGIAITQSQFSSDLAVSLELPQKLQKNDEGKYQFTYKVDFTVAEGDNFDGWITDGLNLYVNGKHVPSQGQGEATVLNPWSAEVPESKGTLNITETLDDAACSTGKLSAYAKLNFAKQGNYTYPLFISPTLYSDVSLVKFVDSDAADAAVLDVYLAETGSVFDMTKIAEPEREEHDFAGWYYTDAGGAEHAFNGTIAVGGEMIVYAKWDEPFNGVGGLVAILDDVPFVDVAFNDYFYDSVKWAYHNGVTGGTDAWHFSPDAGCTRAQAVTFLWRAAGCPTAAYLGNFSDVDADAYYAPAVAWAVANGVTNGTSATTFSPEAACSRGDIVTFLYRAFGGVSNGYHPFGDVAANAYYADAVAWAYEHNVTGGTSATAFSPADACTRAQIVTFLYRVLG